MICIQVYEQKSGKPLENARIVLEFHSFTRLGQTPEERTDNKGCAYFDREPDSDVTVYVNGKNVHRGRIEGKEILYV